MQTCASAEPPATSEKRLYCSSLVSYVLSLQRTKFYFFWTFSLPPVTDSTVVFLTVAFILNDLFYNFSSTVELSSSYILPLQTTDKTKIVLFWFSCYVFLLFGCGVKVIPRSVCVQQESVHLLL